MSFKYKRKINYYETDKMLKPINMKKKSEKIYNIFEELLVK